VETAHAPEALASPRAALLLRALATQQAAAAAARLRLLRERGRGERERCHACAPHTKMWATDCAASTQRQKEATEKAKEETRPMRRSASERVCSGQSPCRLVSERAVVQRPRGASCVLRPTGHRLHSGQSEAPSACALRGLALAAWCISSGWGVRGRAEGFTVDHPAHAVLSAPRRFDLRGHTARCVAVARLGCAALALPLSLQHPLTALLASPHTARPPCALPMARAAARPGGALLLALFLGCAVGAAVAQGGTPQGGPNAPNRAPTFAGGNAFAVPAGARAVARRPCERSRVLWPPQCSRSA